MDWRGSYGRSAKVLIPPLVSGGNARERIFSCAENRTLLLESLGNAIERQTKDSCGLLRLDYPCDSEAGV